MGWFRSAATGRDDDVPSFEERLAGVGPGVPGHCPACDGLGYIDNIDIAHRYQIQHCKACLHRWEYLFDEDGVVVGLTELDAEGQPVTRSRVRVAPTAPLAGAEPAPAPLDQAAPASEDEDAVVDVRDPAVAEPPVLDLTAPEQLSPAEWLRQSVRH